MSKVSNVLVVGANRGLGLGLVKEVISELGAERVFATYRNADQSKELLDLAAANPRIVPLQLDFQDVSKFPEIAKTIEQKTGGAGLNLLINNAALGDKSTQSLANVTLESLLSHYTVNAAAPLLLSKALVPLLEKASAANPSAPLGIRRAVIVNITSGAGSMTLNNKNGPKGGGGDYPYNASKSALNQITRSLAVDLRPKNIIAVVLHPGWVQTDMGGAEAHLTVKQSVSGMVKVIAALKEEDAGEFLGFDGNKLPW